MCSSDLEFECGNVRDMVKYINAIAPELARGIQPRFVQEKAAVGEYVRQHEQLTIRVFDSGPII